MVGLSGRRFFRDLALRAERDGWWVSVRRMEGVRCLAGDESGDDCRSLEERCTNGLRRPSMLSEECREMDHR